MAEYVYEAIVRRLEVCKVPEREKREILAMVISYGKYCVDEERRRQLRDRIA